MCSDFSPLRLQTHNDCLEHIPNHHCADDRAESGRYFADAQGNEIHGGRILGENEQKLKLLAERLALDGFSGKSDFFNDGLHVFGRLRCEGGHQPGDCEIDQSSERADTLW